MTAVNRGMFESMEEDFILMVMQEFFFIGYWVSNG
jgi:hypothetical protein